MSANSSGKRKASTAIQIVRIDDDGSAMVKFSPEGLAFFAKILAAARPAVEVEIQQKQSADLERGLERLNAVEREIKSAQMAEVFDLQLQRHLSLKRGPLDWPVG